MAVGTVPTSADPLHIAAAANLQDVLTKALIPAFTHSMGIEVVPTFGATKQLAIQIEHGAPVDVFVAADTKSVAKLAKEGEILQGTETEYAIGQLVLWTRSDSALHPQSIADLSSASYAHIAIANPDTAPYGRAAVTALQRAGIYDSVQPRIVQAENIAQALQYARSGNADVALTALSLVVTDNKDPYVIVPGSLHDPIAQSAGVVAGTHDATDAKSFLAFLVGPTAAPIWKSYGYLPPGSAH